MVVMIFLVVSLIVRSLGEGSVGSGFDTKVGFDCACPLFCFCEWDPVGEFC
jgi:hypothetical protein